LRRGRPSAWVDKSVVAIQKLVALLGAAITAAAERASAVPKAVVTGWPALKRGVRTRGLFRPLDVDLGLSNLRVRRGKGKTTVVFAPAVAVCGPTALGQTRASLQTGIVQQSA